MFLASFPPPVSFSVIKHHSWKNYHFTLLPLKAQYTLFVIQITEFLSLHKPSCHEASQAKNLYFHLFQPADEKLPFYPFFSKNDLMTLKGPLELHLWSK